MWGERDEWLDPEFGRRLSDAIPQARLSLIPDAGHFLREDHPGPLAAELGEFFAEG